MRDFVFCIQQSFQIQPIDYEMKERNIEITWQKQYSRHKVPNRDIMAYITKIYLFKYTENFTTEK